MLKNIAIKTFILFTVCLTTHIDAMEKERIISYTRHQKTQQEEEKPIEIDTTATTQSHDSLKKQLHRNIDHNASRSYQLLFCNIGVLATCITYSYLTDNQNTSSLSYYGMYICGATAFANILGNWSILHNAAKQKEYVTKQLNTTRAYINAAITDLENLATKTLENALKKCNIDDTRSDSKSETG